MITIPRLFCLLIFSAFAAPALAQAGGTMKIGDETLRIEAEEIARQSALSRRIDPTLADADVLENAWTRAVRIAAAKALGVTVEPAEFTAWMKERHAGVADTWLTDGTFDRERLRLFVTNIGFRGIDEYLAWSREEFLIDELVERDLPELDVSEADVRARFEQMATGVSAEALVIARDTIDDDRVTPLDPNDADDLALYRRWFATLSDQQKKILDDVEHPALEAEAIYVRYFGLSPDEFQTWFEEERGTLGTSIAERTKDLEPNALEMRKLGERWQLERRRHFSWLNAMLPPGLDDAASFELVADHMVRLWKVLEYLGRLWHDLAARERQPGVEALDLRAVAEETGLDWRYIPKSTVSVFLNDPFIASDAPFPMLRVTQPGKLFDYNTSPEKPNSIYFVEGVVDQPGYHATIFRLIDKELMRVRPADEVIERGWPIFVELQRWERALEEAAQIGKTWRRLLEEGEDEARAKGEEPDMRAIRRGAFDRLEEAHDQLEKIGPVYAQPFTPDPPSADRRSQLGVRVGKLIEKSWRDMGGAWDVPIREGDVMRFVLSRDFELGAVVRILRVAPPRPSRFEVDSRLKLAARNSLLSERLEEREADVTAKWSWPAMVERFEIVTADFETTADEKR